MWVRIPPPALLLLQALLHRADLVVERLLLVAALVQLQHRVDAREAHLEWHSVKLADDRQDVLGRALQRGAHRMELVPDPILGGESPLDLGDVLGGARVRAAEPDHGEVRGRHRSSIVEAVNVVIVGGHGKIGMRLSKILAERGDSPRGIIRKTEQADDLEKIGAEPIVLDIENVEIDDAVAGADAVVFAAGAGPGSGPARKLTVDYGGAVKSVDAAIAQEIRRFVIVSSINANRPENWSEEMKPYFEAKADADKFVAESGLDYTIVRPGSLTDDPGTGKVSVDGGGPPSISRDDVALVLAEVLNAENTIGKAFDLLGGETPVAEALAAL